MDDLISRQKALEFTVSHGINIGAKIYVPLGDVTKYLRELPSIDAVPVVRCKDCKWRDTWACSLSTRDNWFCRKGERKE